MTLPAADTERLEFHQQLETRAMMTSPSTLADAQRDMRRPGKHSRGNPLGTLAMEGTVMLMLALPLAFVVSLYRIDWFFPAMLLVIGGRYFTFATLYGARMFWVLGGILAVAAFVLVATKRPPVVGAFTGGIIELAFAAALFAASRESNLASLQPR